jgi:dipeptidyl aminopeptidase/acylaminoacyl peptidase
MSEKLKQHGIPFEFKSFDNGGHDLTGHKEEVDKALVGWFKTHL